MITQISSFGKVGRDWWLNTGTGRNQNITAEQGVAILSAAQQANQPMRPHYHGIHTVFHFEPRPFLYNGVKLTEVGATCILEAQNEQRAMFEDMASLTR